MSYTVAGVDVHKKLLVVVAADVSQPEWTFECRRFGTGQASCTIKRYGCVIAVPQRWLWRARRNTGSQSGWNWNRT